MLELARVFNANRDKLRRGLVFGFWTGHETGTMVGSSWWVDRNWDRLREHAVAYLQIDQPACAGTTRWAASANAELKRFHQEAEKRVLGGREATWRRAAKNGDSSFFGLGIPMVAAQGSYTEAELKQAALANLGWWHHSIENTIDKLDFAYMGVHLQVYAAYLWELCTAVVLPYEFVTVADHFIARLDELSKDAGSVGLDGAGERARAFKGAAERLDAAAQDWRRRYADGSAKDEGPAEVLNACLKRLSRTLVPLASTSKGAYGHDPYGYTPQGTMIPSLFDAPRLATLPDGEERWMLETQLVRARNQVADALDDCRRLIDDTLSHLR
jgi:hypothetical protein